MRAFLNETPAREFHSPHATTQKVAGDCASRPSGREQEIPKINDEIAEKNHFRMETS